MLFRVMVITIKGAENMKGSAKTVTSMGMIGL